MREIMLTLRRKLSLNLTRRVQVSWEKCNKESHQICDNNAVPCEKLSIMLLWELLYEVGRSRIFILINVEFMLTSLFSEFSLVIRGVAYINDELLNP